VYTYLWTTRVRRGMDIKEEKYTQAKETYIEMELGLKKQ
jgi:hypothetical protein